MASRFGVALGRRRGRLAAAAEASTRISPAEWPSWGLQVGVVATALAVGVLAGIDFRLAIAAVLGIGFAAVVAADITAGLCLFVFVSFLEMVPGNPLVSFTKVAGLLLALSWLATLVVRGEARRQFFSAHPVATYLLTVFLAWAALSAIWAESEGAALTAASRFGLNFLLVPIVYTATRERRHGIWITLAFVAGAVASAVYGLVAGPPASTEGRLSGAAGDPNEVATVLVAGLVLAAVLAAIFRRSPVVRLAMVAAVGLCALGVFLTLSRGGLVALALAMIASLFVAGRWRARAAVLTAVTVVGALAYFAAFAPLEARERVTTIEGGSGRSDIWTVGWRMVEEHPVGGVGVGNFEVSSIHYLLEPGAILRDEFIVDTPKVAHNTYLQVLAELGVVGLVLFLSILAFSLGCAVKAARRFMRMDDVAMEMLTRGLIVALIGMLVAGIFISAQFSNQLWLLLALGPSLLAISQHPRAGTRDSATGDARAL
jgi:O-antigen ligase